VLTDMLGRTPRFSLPTLPDRKTRAQQEIKTL
jgi:hypothetical protein